MIAAAVVLGVVCLALVAYIAWDKREQAKSQAAQLAGFAEEREALLDQVYTVQRDFAQEREAVAAERTQLLDRIQAPGAAAFAAMEAAVPYEPPEPPPDLYTEPVPQSDDLALLALVRED